MAAPRTAKRPRRHCFCCGDRIRNGDQLTQVIDQYDGHVYVRWSMCRKCMRLWETAMQKHALVAAGNRMMGKAS